MRDLMPDTRPARGNTEGHKPTAYPSLEDAVAAALGQVQREHPQVTCERFAYRDDYTRLRFDWDGGKSFRELSRNGEGWVQAAPKDKPLPLYHADRLTAAETIYIAEGERKVHALESLHLAATTSGSCTSARSRDWTPLRGKSIVILPDADGPGDKYAQSVADILGALGCAVKSVFLPGLPDGGDIVDFLELRDGHDADEIRAEIETLAAQADARPQLPPMMPVIQLANEIIEQPIAWLWENRLELGALNLIASDPGNGKSLLTAAIGAAVTCGARWPDCRASWVQAPRNVIFISSEDDPAKATRPRLRAAGARLERVAIVRTVIEDGRERQLCLQRDLLAVEHAITTVGDVALIVIDPVDSYLGKTDSNTNEEVRQVLEPLVALAERHNTCILAVKHLNKSVASPSALYRIAGTMAFVALPRTVHIISHEEDDKARKLLLPLKVSHGPRPDGLAYRIHRDDEGLPVVQWESETVAADADEVLSRNPRRGPTATERAVNWLRDALAAGPIPSRELDGQADAVGIPHGTLRKAKDTLGVVAMQLRDGARVKGWQVSLPH